MINQVKCKKMLQSVLCSLALVGSVSLGYAQSASDYIVNQFDDGLGGGLWAPNYGDAPMTIEFDAVEDRGPGASPGSMKVTINFNPCTTPPDPLYIQRDFERVLAETLDLTKYTKLHFSVKVDPSSSHLSDWGAGAFGGLRPHIRLSDWGGDSNLGSAPDNVWVGADSYTGWVDYSYPIDQTLGNLATRQATGILGIDIWSGWGSCAAPIGHTNTVIFWMDNIWFEYDTNTVPPPPPTMGLAKAGSVGVEITMDDKGSQYQRDAISTPSAGGPYFWTSQGGYPVTYSLTIADFPDSTSHTNFEAHMYIVNQDTSGGNETYGGADWNVPDIFILRIENVAPGDVQAKIQLKTNQPNSNPPADAIHEPVIVHGPTAVGTWTVTFTDSTSGALSGPGITTTNFTLSAAAVANSFSPTASFMQFGMFKNDVPNDGHNNNAHGTFSRVQFTGASAPFDDNFSGPTLTNTYAWRTTSASAVQHIPQGTAWMVDWTVPDAGFNAQIAPSLSGPWSAAGFSSKYQSAAKTHGLLPATSLPAGNSAYFRLIKRPFTKLQVLLPGETAAPNTVTGKTGTPDAQANGVSFNVRVNAVDDVWNLVNSTDIIAITSSDTTATLPANASLGAGTATFAVTLNATGSWTVTATDVTDGTKTPATSSSIAIP